MSFRTAQERCEHEEDERDREFPRCKTCDLRVGWDCEGHCDNCQDTPAKGDDFCSACIVKINRIENTAKTRKENAE